MFPTNRPRFSGYFPFLLFWAMLLYLPLSAKVYRVGASFHFSDPYTLSVSGALKDGDTVLIAPGIYSGQAATALWSASHLLIRGEDGMAEMVADGHHNGGKAIWVVSGDHITVENIAFYNCTVPDRNGAGIRSEGKGLTIKDCRFIGNENGVLSNSPYAGHILIERSEFGYNGYSDGYSHNVYINHVDTFTFRFNYSHHARTGHHVKSRATSNFILCNRISDEAEGNSSRLIDLPNGGFSVVTGNVLMQGPMAENNNLVGYGMEGLTNPAGDFYFVNNTLVNKRESSCRFLQLAETSGATAVINNIFAGKGIIVEGTPSILVANLASEDPEFFRFNDEPANDYRLTAESPAADAGIDPGMVHGVPLLPRWVYMHPADSAKRENSGLPDIGAYGYQAPGSVQASVVRGFFLFPNPAYTFDMTRVVTPVPCKKFLLVGSGGGEHRVDCGPQGFRLPSAILPGLYCVKLIGEKGVTISKMVVLSR